MPQDAFSIYHTAKELNDKLSGARTERINQPEKYEIVIFLRKNNENIKLILNANADYARVCVSEANKESPIQAPNFCMLLRKHLSRASVQKIESVPFERIIVITFACKDEIGTPSSKLLYCEIMGKYSNLTLTENGKILGAIKTTSFGDDVSRPVFPGIDYTLPPPQSKADFADKLNAEKVLKSYCEGDFARFVFDNFKGVSLKTANELVYRYFLEKNISAFDIKTFNFGDFISYFENFYEFPKIAPRASRESKNGDFFITEYKTYPYKTIAFESIISAIDFYYANKENSFAFNLKKTRLKDIINSYKKKQEKKLQLVLEKLVASSDYEEYRLKGELVIAYIYKIKKGQKVFEAENYNEESCPLVKIELDEKLSPEQNAEKFFKQYNKKKKTIAALIPQQNQINEIINYCLSVIMDIDNAENIEDFSDIEEELRTLGLIKQPQAKRQKTKLSSPRRYEFGGYEIYVGKNNVQNDRLTLSADRNDLWLHAKDYHSSHVIIKNNGREFSDKVILYAAEICAFYSNARSSTKIPVDYTLKKFVKKPAGARIGTVYYTNQKTIFVDPDEHRQN